VELGVTPIVSPASPFHSNLTRVDGIHLTPFETGEIGPDLFRHLEGLVSKHRERAYRAGQCPHWVKVKNRAHPAFSRVADQF
jgi:bifunctional non-homologous end joining protein LigD